MSFPPPDIVEEILKHLPPFHLFPVLFVNRKWYQEAKKNLIHGLSTKGSTEVDRVVSRHNFAITTLLVWNCKRANRDTVDWIIQTLRPNANMDFIQEGFVCKAAAFGGDLDMLRSVRAAGFSWTITSWTAASTKGDTSMLDYLKANDCPDTYFEMEENSIGRRAGYRGDLDILNWFYTNRYHYLIPDVIRGAAEAGNREIIKWLMDKGFQLDSQVMTGAAQTSDPSLLLWLRSLGCPWDETACAAAAKHGQIEVLQWLHENGCPWSAETSHNAIKAGHLRILEYARERGCPWEENKVATIAAQNGHLDILQWISINGGELHEQIYNRAAYYGHFHVIKWARENDCPWQESACSNAAAGGHLDILQWLRDKGCPWDSLVTVNAACAGRIDILRYAKENRCRWDGLAACLAAQADQIDTLEWLRENDAPWDVVRIKSMASPKSLKWLESIEAEPDEVN
ncbi:hypothetical protein PROFUN_05061 [Planoprotostelium fungivorum]|uniref:F-box domain-containing protein n=1 Tax=Planoprotostelium fungivorum TaxID=1890364 RepID=A0A2P6NSA5_9EUKA|nr:hypothetical protein PROFUN_05061 [Planoprotostelium fungivorum]